MIVVAVEIVDWDLPRWTFAHSHRGHWDPLMVVVVVVVRIHRRHSTTANVHQSFATRPA